MYIVTYPLQYIFVSIIYHPSEHITCHRNAIFVAPESIRGNRPVIFLGDIDRLDDVSRI